MLLDSLVLDNAVVTIDAMGTAQRKIVRRALSIVVGHQVISAISSISTFAFLGSAAA